MALRTRGQASRPLADGLRLMVVRGQTDEAQRAFTVGEEEPAFTVGSRGDWRVTAPGVVGVHLRLAFDGRTLFAAAASGSAMLGNRPLGSEWSALGEGDEVRFGFALLRVGSAASAGEAPRAVRSFSGKQLAWALGGACALIALVVVLLATNRAPAEQGTPAASASSVTSTPTQAEVAAAATTASSLDREPTTPPPIAAGEEPKPLQLVPAAEEPSNPAPNQAFEPAAAAAQPARPPVAFAQNIANRPIPRVGSEPWLISDEWRAHHERLLRAAGRASAKVIFLGDSITEGWWSASAYKEYFGKYSPVNLGIASDTTQNVLWRLQNGALSGTKPRVVVTMVGINNLAGGFSPEDTAGGLRSIVAAIQKELPETKVLLLAILPARQDASNPLRQRIKKCNELLQSLARPGSVELLDVGSVLLEPDGSISKTILRDYLHPTPVGYEKLSSAVAPKLAELVGN